MDFFWAFICFTLILALMYVVRELLKAKLLAAQSALLLEERNTLRAQLETATTARVEAEKQVGLSEQKMAGLELRMKDWETQRAESVQAAKAAILEAGGQMSNKLLEDHKREQEATKKEQEARVQKATATLMEQMTALGQSVASLKDDGAKNTQQVQTMWRALTNPASAGQLSEFGLENALKNMGLEKDRDFATQFPVPGQSGEGSLRPDAVVFLPQDMVLVIDSKASKFLMELAEAEGTDQEAALREKLVASMQKHIRDLASKDYASAISNAFKARGNKGPVGKIINVMYLHSESAWEKLYAYDPDCRSRLEKANLIPASPATLMGLFSLSTMQIAEARQMDNHHAIMDAAAGLIESVGTMVTHMDKIGKGISGAMNAFNDVASSTNARIIPRMRKLVGMGVKAPKTKDLPNRVQTYDMRRQDDMTMIEGEATLVDGDDAPEKPQMALTGN